jgi:asparagine synthase (glutamine-hydrolysing)
MVDHLQHRGPDGAAVEVVSQDSGATVVLGHTRLSIIDLSPGGKQPMSDPTRQTCVTFNGEIYNYRALRDELTGSVPWQSTSDTEVLLRAFARWGRTSLQHLRGMFALAIWDAERRELFLARDRLGIKPLYYASLDDGGFVFGSEVRALLASGVVRRQLDHVSVRQYLTYQSVPSPRTLVQGIHSLPPASWLVVDEFGRVTDGTYWQAIPEQTNGLSSPVESRRQLADLLRDSVAAHLVSDVPVGAFLSGGIDSTAIVALMREVGTVPRTFSVGFADAAFDESSYARQVAQQFQTEHTEVLLREHDLLDQLPAALQAMDQPTGDGVNTYVVSRAVRDTGIKVALSGLGGDELFAGYPSFARLGSAAPLFRVWGRAPARVRSLAAVGVRSLGGSSVAVGKAAEMLASDGHLASLYPLTRQVLSRAQQQLLVSNDVSAAYGSQADPYSTLLRNAFRAHPKLGTLTSVSLAEMRTYMHDVLLRDTDQMSMARALEVRVPFLDHPVVEYVMSLPDSLKHPNGTPKRLLVEALGGLLPQRIVHRPKQGFTLPLEPWMRGPLRHFCEERLTPERVSHRGLFEPTAVTELWRGFLTRRPDVKWSRPWLLVVLEEWLQRNGF